MFRAHRLTIATLPPRRNSQCHTCGVGVDLTIATDQISIFFAAMMVVDSVKGAVILRLTQFVAHSGAKQAAGDVFIARAPPGPARAPPRSGAWLPYTGPPAILQLGPSR